MVYGGAHAAAWNSHLPTPVERLLWRISSIIAGSCVPACLLLGVGGIGLGKSSSQPGHGKELIAPSSDLRAIRLSARSLDLR